MEGLPPETAIPLHLRPELPICLDTLQDELTLLFISFFAATSLSTLVAYKVIRKFKKRRVLKRERHPSSSEMDSEETRTPSPSDQDLTGEAGDLFLKANLLNQGWKSSIIDALHTRALDKLQVDPSRTCVAGLVVVSPDFEEIIDVSCVASSPRTHSRSIQSLPRISLNDLRALTLVRRCFLRFLYEDLHSILTHGAKEGQILTRKADGYGFTRRTDIKLILVLNSQTVDLMEREERDKIFPQRSMIKTVSTVFDYND